tara:strand:- start:95 stop:235 length:141 start_codon:yes stop_codon:yes gene_type:complete
MGKREPNMEDAPYRLFRAEKEVSKKKKKKPSYKQLDIFDEGNTEFY